MREITLHLLDIAENSVTALAQRIEIAVREDLPANRLCASVQDNGKGMDAETVSRLADPFFTSRTTRKVGLGVPLFKAAAEACNGVLEISSHPDTGTTISVEFQRDHIDRMPLGNFPDTMLALLIAHPEINWRFEYAAILAHPQGQTIFSFDDAPIKEVLGDVPLSEPEVLTYLREILTTGVTGIQEKIDQTELSTAQPLQGFNTEQSWLNRG